MKRAIIIIAILLIASTSFAMGKGGKTNIHMFGSDDSQGHSYRVNTTSIPPDRPVSPVPEPATLLLLGAGLVGIAAWARRK